MEIEKESIFKSAIRSFFKALLGMLGFYLALVPILLIIFSVTKTRDLAPIASKTNLKILPDLNGNQYMQPISSPVILRVNINGVIGCDNCANPITAEAVEAQLIDSQKGLLKGNRIKAILLYVNTPGGTVIDSDNIYQYIKAYKEKYKIPVYAFVNGLCASGGMYISSACDKIFATDVSIIGSIGVRSGPFFNYIKGMDKIGVGAKTLTVGKDKDLLNPFKTWKENEGEDLKNIIKSHYIKFVDVVTTNRPNVDKEKLVNEYGAQIFDSHKSKEIGYIDEDNATYNSTLIALMKDAKIDIDKSYQIVELAPKKNLFNQLFSKCLSIKSFLGIDDSEKDLLYYKY